MDDENGERDRYRRRNEKVLWIKRETTNVSEWRADGREKKREREKKQMRGTKVGKAARANREEQIGK